MTPVSEPLNPSHEPESNVPISSSETFQIAETPPLGSASQEPLPESQPPVEPVQMPEPVVATPPPVVVESELIQPVAEPDPVPVV